MVYRNRKRHGPLAGIAALGLVAAAHGGETPADAATRGLGRMPESRPAAPPPSASPPPTAAEPPVPRPEAGMHTAAINQAAVTADGRLLTVSDDKTARLWRLERDAAPGRGLGRPGGAEPAPVLRVPLGPRNEGKLYAVAVSPVKNRAVVAGSTGLGGDGATSVYYVIDLATRAIVATVPAVPGSVRVLSYSSDGRHLAIGSAKGWLRVIDLDNKDKPTAFLDSAESACGDEVTAARFLRDGRLVTACADGRLRLYDNGFRLTQQYRFPAKRRPWRVAVSPQEDRIAVGSETDPLVDLFATADLRPLSQLKGAPGQRGGLSVVAWSGDAILAAGTYGNAQGTKYLRTWNPATQEGREWPLAGDIVSDLQPLPDGRVAYVTAEPAIGWFDPRSSAVVSRHQRIIPDFRDAFEGSFALSADGNVVDFGLAQGGRKPLRFDFPHRSLIPDPPPRADLGKPRIPPDLKNWRNSPKPTLAGKPLALGANERSLAAAAGADGGALIGGDFSLQLWRKGRQVWNIDVPAPAWAVNLAANGRVALAALGDGTLRWYDAADGRERLALFVTTDGRWLLWNPEGYFDHGEAGADLIGYHLNQFNQGKAATPRFVLSGQLHQHFYRPDLLGGGIPEAGAAPKSAPAGTVQALLAERQAPDVKLTAWCVQGRCTEVAPGSDGRWPEIKVAVPEVTLRFELADRGSGVGPLVLRRNQANVSSRGVALAADPPRTPASGPLVLERSVALEPGENLITATAFDAGQALDAGEPVRLPVRYEAAAPAAPNLYVVSVGIDAYAAAPLKDRPLKNAVNDAVGIAERLAATPKDMFAAAHSVVLTNEKASLAAIRQALREVAGQARPNDLVVLFLAGHGTALDGRYYFLPYDADASGEERAKATALNQEQLTEAIATLPASRMVVLIDSCYSGAFAVSNSVSQDRVSQDRSWAVSLGQNTGRVVLAGTSREQEASDGLGGHGLFTAVLLDGLSGKADQEVRGNRDRFVDVLEILEYTRRQVPEEARKISHSQNATFYYSGNDFFNLSEYKP